MLVTNNSAEQINAALLSIKPRSNDVNNLLEAKRQTILDEEEQTSNPIDDAIFQFNNAYYFSINRKYTRDPINVQQNFFVFGELQMIWGTFMGGGAASTSTYTVTSISPEKFQSEPLAFACYFWIDGSMTEVGRKLTTYNKANNTITFVNQTVNNSNLWPESYVWCLIGKVQKEAT